MTNWSSTGDPRSVVALRFATVSAIGAGASIQPSRSPGASDLLAEPSSTPRSGIKPWRHPMGSRS